VNAVVFWVLAPLAVLGALGMVLSRKAVHSVIWMALSMIMLAFLYINQQAPFLGVVQIVVYAGAVIMLFLFVVMLVGVDASDSHVETIRGQRVGAVLAALGLALLLAVPLGRAALGPVTGLSGTTGPAAAGNVQGIAELLFTRYVWAFEITSALLITAALAAMVLAHQERTEARATQRELAQRRFRRPDPSPLPPPGTYARHNAVDTPALLPDGTPAEVSVPAALRARGAVRPKPLEPARQEVEQP